MTGGAAATGLRAVLIARSRAWMTPRRKRFVTVVLMSGGLIAAALLGPSGS